MARTTAKKKGIWVPKSASTSLNNVDVNVEVARTRRCRSTTVALEGLNVSGEGGSESEEEWVPGVSDEEGGSDQEVVDDDFLVEEDVNELLHQNSLSVGCTKMVLYMMMLRWGRYV